MYLEKINCPQDLKKLNINELNVLAKEIRQTLLNKLSKTGGHVGSNLGMVEATIALHYVFNSPVDKIVFDVSHQSYSHKILTGRKDAYLYEEKYKEVSGYTNPNESKHDFFNIGHTSTSISLASGLAKARDLKGDKENIIAVIGDGSLSGGEALEGLDFVSELNSNFIIVVNDNNMAIAENHGGIYKNLEKLRETNGKYECNLFKAMGLDYIYQNDGNNIEKLIEAFSRVKDIDHPIVVHIRTIKGMGYEKAEKYKEIWHSKGPFDLKTGESLKKDECNGYFKITRDFLLEKMKKDKTVTAIVAGVPNNIGFIKEKRIEAGDQFVDVGLAEEHSVAMASGMAKNNTKPILAIYSSFIQRTYDQLSQDLCLNNNPATILVNKASVYATKDVTHLGLFDIPLIANIPNIVYLSPTSKEEYIAMLDWSIEQTEHPVAIRVPCNGVYSYGGVVDKDYSNLNKFKVEKKGNKVAIIALGDFYQLGEKLTEAIEKNLGIKPTLINPRYITGVDENLLKNLCKNHELVLTLEDGILDGGFGEKISSFYGTTNMKVKNYGIQKSFPDRYVVDELLRENGISEDQILSDIKSILNIK